MTVFWQLMTAVILWTACLRGDGLWLSDPHAAFQKAKSEEKSLVIAFLGVPWCPWSQKMEQEVLLKTHFIESLSKEAVLLRLNFSNEGRGSVESMGLKEKYDVQEFPTLVLATALGDEILKMGYLAMNEADFSNHIINQIDHFETLETVCQGSRLEAMSLQEVQSLYRHSLLFPKRKYREKLLQIGLSRDQESPYFLLEKYAYLIEQGKRSRDPEIVRVRKDIRERDPDNISGGLLRLALLDFEFLCRKLRKRDDPAAALGPLVEYVKKHGDKDPQNLWKVHLMISQYLFAKGHVKEAIGAAKKSQAVAPDEEKEEISKTLYRLKR